MLIKLVGLQSEMSVDYLKEVEAIKPLIAEAADRFVLPRFGKLKEEDIVRKGRYDELVTLADTESSDFVLPVLRARFPGSFTEEHMSEDRFDHDIVWVADTLDGTDEFRHGHRGFCLQAALLKRRSGLYVSVAGLIYLPLEKKFVYATESEGPFVDHNGKISKVAVPKADKIIATQREMDYSKELEAFYEFLRRKGYHVEVLHTGAAGATFVQMITGPIRPNLYVMPRPYTKEWDVSPADPVIVAAGGWVRTLDFDLFNYNRKNPKNERGYVAAIGHKEGLIKDLLEEFGGVDAILRDRA